MTEEELSPFLVNEKDILETVRRKVKNKILYGK